MAEHQKFNIRNLDELHELSRLLGLDIPQSEDLCVVFEPGDIQGHTVPNRLVIQPMEGFDSKPDGGPGELTRRRYLRYAMGGAGIIWFEATSIDQGGRSNPQQLYINKKNIGEFKGLVEDIRKAARDEFGSGHNPFLVLQLTHSGRFSKPEGKPTGICFAENPYLDPSGKSMTLMGDIELERIRDDFCMAIEFAGQAGFDSVDIKISHGYLLHEILAAYQREDSKYGGSYENRSRIIRDLVSYPTNLVRSIRLNAADFIPYPYGFGMSKDGSLIPDLDEAVHLINDLQDKVPLWNITAGVPYYNPHVNRPFDTPLKGAEIPKEHPLQGIDRMIALTAHLQKEFPDLPMVGSAYSWLRQFFPNVGAGVLEQGMASYIGIGRMAFAYPDAPKDLMDKRILDKGKVCTTCSNCTQLMRNKQPSGCTVRDKEYYKL
jgi:2,4-dienoyl-CoA reductase-like NADH-dependent reductase (Old Yellow Enzyme family)